MEKNVNTVREINEIYLESCCICGSDESLKSFKGKHICLSCRLIAKSLKTNKISK